jgi:hypothetical protein
MIPVEFIGKTNTPAAYWEVLDYLAAGEPIKNALEATGVGERNFYRALRADFVFAQEYVRAREAGADALADKTIVIADTETDAQRARNRILARQWAASKFKPRVYGDRLDLTVEGQINHAALLTEARARLVNRPGRDQLNHASAQVIEAQAVASPPASDNQSLDEMLS